MSDALERLKQRTRPTVPSRDASLSSALTTSKDSDIEISRYLDLQNTTTPIPPDAPPVLPSAPAEAVPALETKQTTLRLEKGMSDRLQEFCREQGICREVLLEALFEYCEAHPDIQPEVLAEATAKNEQRQQIANQKRARSMMQRFGQSQ